MRRIALVSLLFMHAVPAFAAAGSDERDKLMEQRYKQCVASCVKPVPKPGREEDVWIKNVRDEARYDNCVHNCDRKYLRGFRK